jgi:hypothetical protein
MKNYLLRKVLFVLFCLNIFSCGRYMSSPSIWFFNMSDDYIYSTNGVWNGYFVLGGSELEPGDIPSENLILKHQSDIFGPVRLQFTNAKGELITKDFIFTKDQLPNSRYHNFDNIYIFLTQNGVELFTQGQKESESKAVSENWYKTKQLSRDFSTICPHNRYNCHDLMPIYKPSNMPKINQARKIYEEQEKQRLKNIEEYHKRKAKEKEQQQ